MPAPSAASTPKTRRRDYGKPSLLPVGSFSVFNSGPLHAAPSSGGDAVQGLYDVLLSTMKSGKALGQSGRFTQLEPVIRRSFDIAAMA